ncbi:O-antigen ligase family protein [Pseudoalteromonas carrageenovora]|uniref:O-antigen ligase family protein n=1 Tax=Pseudoalteromonas carrageenovora TaxID=227 RepID=UPI00311F63F9
MNLLLLFIIGSSLAILLLLPLIFLLLYLFNSNTYLKTYLYSILLSMLFYFYICLYLPISESDALYFSSSGRFEMWQNSIYEGLNLFSGIGTGNYSYRIDATVLSHPHNSIIQILIESGILSGILIIFILGKIFWVQFNNRSNSTEAEKVYFLAFICWIVYYLVSGLMVMPVTQAIACLLLGSLMRATKYDAPIVVNGIKFICSYFPLFTVPCFTALASSSMLILQRWQGQAFGLLVKKNL